MKFSTYPLFTCATYHMYHFTILHAFTCNCLSHSTNTYIQQLRENGKDWEKLVRAKILVKDWEKLVKAESRWNGVIEIGKD